MEDIRYYLANTDLTIITKAKVIEDGFHAVSMLCGNIVLDIFHAYPSIANIGKGSQEVKTTVFVFVYLLLTGYTIVLTPFTP